MLELQGEQVCAPGPVQGANGGVKRDPLTGEDILYNENGDALNPCGSLQVTSAGLLSTEEFGTAMYDLTNFLVYMGEPVAEERKRLGVYVLMFLALFFVFAYLLNREYWKDIH